MQYIMLLCLGICSVGALGQSELTTDGHQSQCGQVGLKQSHLHPALQGFRRNEREIWVRLKG